MGILPTRKYQSDGGPGIRDIVDLLKTFSSNAPEDVDTFLDSIVYTWLIAGTDAHAKNYALLIAAHGQVRLAPLYDIASILPYHDIDIEKAKFSMKIGGEYRLRNIGAYHWRKLAQELRIDPEIIVPRIDNIVQKLTEQIPEVVSRLRDEGLKHTIVDRLAKALTNRITASRKLLR